MFQITNKSPTTKLIQPKTKESAKQQPHVDKLKSSLQGSNPSDVIPEKPGNVVTIESNQIPVVGSNNVVASSNGVTTNQINPDGFHQQQVSLTFTNFFLTL